MTLTRTYSELIKLPTYQERLEYLKLHGQIGDLTFGDQRYLNQKFYNSPEWKRFRHQIILRDNGCDLGVPGLDIQGIIYVHHLNPICVEDLVEGSMAILDPENVICTSDGTHKIITYDISDPYSEMPIERRPGDTAPWKGNV